MRGLTASLIDDGRLGEAAALADALISRNPRDATALVLRSRVALLSGDLPGALHLAARAHRAAVTDDQRYAAARIAARVHAEQENYTRAQWWLRRADNAAPDAAARRAVAEEFATVRRLNPLTVSLQFGISPTSNVNGGSASEVIVLPGLPFEFVLDGEARALSGIQFQAGTNLSWRLHEDADSALILEGGAQGRTYALSPEARELAPDARGSDFSDISANIGLSYRWLPPDARGPWSLNGTIGRTWYDGSPYLGMAQLQLAKSTRFDGGRRLDISAFVEGQDRISDDEQFVALGGRARWSWDTASGDTASLSLSLRDTLSELEDVAYDGLAIGGTWQFDDPILTFRVGLGADVEFRYFAQSAYSFDAREDWRTSLRATIGLPDYSYFGFEPQITLRAGRTESNVALYDSNNLSIDFGLRSTF